MSIHELHVNGVGLQVRLAGQGPLVLCLHGFPDSVETFDALVPELVAAGFRVAVPAMRGYAPSALADDYRTPTLGRDALGLIHALGESRAAIVGHDWGAVVAYAAAALEPGAVTRLVACAVPHPRRFLRLSPAQLRRSWYMALFQLRGVAESAIRARDFALIRRLWRVWSPTWDFTESDLAPVLDNFRQPGRITAALAYYRELPGGLVDPRASEAAERRRLLGPIAVPTLSVAGADDGCIGVQMFAGQQHLFSAGYDYCELAGAGHFMHRERPDEFAAAAISFLQRR